MTLEIQPVSSTEICQKASDEKTPEDQTGLSQEKSPSSEPLETDSPEDQTVPGTGTEVFSCLPSGQVSTVSTGTFEEESLKRRSEDQKELETGVSSQEELTSTSKAELTKVQSRLEESRCEWERYKTQLLEDHDRKTSQMRAELFLVRREGEKKKHRWQDERSALLETLNKNQEALRVTEEEAERLKVKATRIAHLESRIQNLEDKRVKKESGWGLLLQLFKVSGWKTR